MSTSVLYPQMKASTTCNNTCPYCPINEDMTLCCHTQPNYNTCPIETNQSSYANIIENYKIKIIEKDRILFDYSKNLKETEKAIESLQKTNDFKDEEYMQLKDNFANLNHQFKQTEILLTKKTEEYTQFKSVTEQRFNVLIKENDSLIEKSNSLQKTVTQQDDRIKKLIDDQKKLKADHEKVTLNNEEKANTLGRYEKLFDELKKDNKQVPSLKRQLTECEAAIIDYKGELGSLKVQCDKLAFDKEEAEHKLQDYIVHNQIEKEHNTSISKLTYDFERISRLNEEREKENMSLIDKVKSTSKDNDTIVHIVTSELGQFTTYLEGINMTSKGIMKIPLNTIQSFASSGLSNNYSLKYEIVSKAIQLLKTKTVEIINESIALVSKLNEGTMTIENGHNELVNERDGLLKELAIMKNTNKDLAIQLKDKANSFNSLTDSYTKLKDTYIKIKGAYADVVAQLEKSNCEHSDFISEIKTKIDKKLTIKNSCCNSPTRDNNTTNSTLMRQLSNPNLHSSLNINNQPSSSNILLHQIENIIEDNFQMNDKIQKLQADELNNQQQFTQLHKDYKELQELYDSIAQKSQNEIEQITYIKESELKSQKDILYDKIKSLTELLEESNQLIQSYEGDNKQLKSRNIKLEYNLQMLTNSHIELEKSINNNTTYLQTAYDDKDMKFNSLLREIELKDIQIKAYEKLCNQSQGQSLQENTIVPMKQVGKIVSVNKADESVGNGDFVKNEDHEKELQKMMCGYNEEGSEIQSTTQNQNNPIQSLDLVNMNNHYSPQKEMRIEENEGNTMDIITRNNTIDIETSVSGGFSIRGRAPGKIYSSKKK